MAVSILAAVLTQYPVGRLSDRMDRRTGHRDRVYDRNARGGSIVVFRDMPHGLFLSRCGLFSGFVLTLYSLAVSHVNDKLEPGQMVAASSALLSLNGTAAAIGPVMDGQSDCRVWTEGVLCDTRNLTGCLTIYDLWRKTRRSPVPTAQKGPFITAQPQGMGGQIVQGAEEKGR